MFTNTLTYKDTHTLEQRIAESNRILSKYPSHIPVIVECCNKLGSLEKPKFLVPSDVSASYLLHSIRKQFENKPRSSTNALFIFCDNLLVCPTTIMSQIYNITNENKKGKEKSDKFMYIYISSENTFGI